jgi:adenylate cyclase
MRATGSEGRLRQPAISVGIGLAVVALVVALSLTRVWDAIEWKVFDLFTSLAAPQRSNHPIVILGIDEPTFQDVGHQWPFPRSLHARLLERVRADGARGIAFDIVFAEPSQPKEDEALAQAIRKAGNVVLASKQELTHYGNASVVSQVTPLQALLEAGAIAGDIGVDPDEDFVVRRQAPADDSLSAQLARFAAVQAPSRRPTLIEYYGPRGTIETRSYYQALEPGLLPPGYFRGKLVLVGHSTRSAVELKKQDMFNSPFAVAGGADRLFPGVEIQATMLANRLSGGGLHEVDGGWAFALIAGLGAIIIVAGRKLHPGATSGVALACVVVVFGLSYTLFNWQRQWLPPMFPVVALAALYASTTLVDYLAARRRAAHVHRMFAQYVPPPVVARLVKQPELMKLGGETYEVTLMFTDLANFTTMSEQLSAQQTVEVLKAYFNTMTAIVDRYEGTVDKFIGDAIMAFWGAPLQDARHAEQAVRAAIDMRAAMEGLVADLRAKGLPSIGMRIGLHTGTAVVGNVGSVTRFSYTAIGDAVNLAARLEGANKAFGTGVLLSETTARQLPPEVRLRPLDDVIVKGKTEPVRVYTPCADEALCKLSEEALAAFHARAWDTAAQRLRELLARKPGDLAATRLLERIEEARGLPADAPWTPAVALDKL